MNPRDISHARNLNLRASLVAMRRAAAEARRIAIQTDTGIVIVRNGKVDFVSAPELRAQMSDGMEYSA